MLGIPTLRRLIAHEGLGAEEGHDLGTQRAGEARLLKQRL